MGENVINDAVLLSAPGFRCFVWGTGFSGFCGQIMGAHFGNCLLSMMHGLCRTPVTKGPREGILGANKIDGIRKE